MRTAWLAASLVLMPIALAHAADMPGHTLPPPIDSAPVVADYGVPSGWYLRGDLGYRWMNSSGVATSSPLLGTPTDNTIGNAITAGLGFGIRTRWLRTDITVDYAAPVTYKGTVATPNDVSAKVNATTALFNGYIDLGTWYGLTPYIGAGAGAAFVNVTDFQRAVPAYAGPSSRSQTNVAYAGMAGVAWIAAPNLQIDLGYRYLNIGDLRTPGDTTGDMTIRNAAAHEVRVGLRWSFDDLPVR